MAFPSASSPLSSPPLTQSFSNQTLTTEEARKYRPTKKLPFELAQHVQTYYEENLFLQAFNFLLSITGNTVSTLNRMAPVTIPPAPHLALAATMVVHPVPTTRTNSREKWDQANAALRLLWLVHNTVGPIEADFATAFTFRRYDFRSTRHVGLRFDDGDDDDEDRDVTGDDEHSAVHDLNSPYAGSQGLWVRAEDFWHVVGWAFNCACLSGIHLMRWNQYRLLLEFLIDVLETDWQLRNAEPEPSPEESLIWQYIELAGGGHARARRIIRAIFADGTARSMGEFRSIFAHELKEPAPENGTVKKREVDVNIEEDIYGDYTREDDSDLSDDVDAASTGTGGGARPSKQIRSSTRTRTPSSRGLTPKSSIGSLRSDYENGEDSAPPPSSESALGDSSSLALRLRLLRLLTYISSHPTLTSVSPTSFPDLDDLFTLFVEFIRPLPLPVFARIVLPSSSPHQIFDDHTRTTLCESILQRILENSAPSIRSHVHLSQTKLEEEYLPFAAGRNSVDANARVSLLLETLTRCMVRLGALESSEQLTSALQKGIRRRMGCVADWGEGKKARKGARREEEAWSWLVESGERMDKVVKSLHR
ncbi:uncharacterized protein Z518_08987 [Rhinocladiella mackenziei CBS 650.93]|uniref:Uncharacterized protein n=1 Tax=Rhinocladiella mackenziei CBS 650.93 TaxID=1442369 RepID=A0A0D2FGV7_9EURO|nr:uncharacterized protein Z518_08987 [Rhinocladiella mackenziei CBS 650.93]KIX01262.1 hypothetical protein Z518_08987 [Rhinocladiella mackenziei CBS 650.93]